MLLSTREISRAMRPRRGSPIEILDRVSLDVAAGELVALLGPSGAGKTSLLRVIAGLDRPDAGEVWLDGENATRWLPARRQIAFAFQRPALLGHRDVVTNIAFGLELRGVPSATRRDRAQLAALRARVPPGLLARRAASLSGGEARRVSLARVLASDARLRLLDEPLAELDELLREELLDSLHAAQRAQPTTTLLVTHARDEAFRLADRIALIDRGRLLACAPLESLRRTPPGLRAAELLWAASAAFLRGRLTSAGAGVRFTSSDGSIALDLPHHPEGPATLCVPDLAVEIARAETSSGRVRVRRVESGAQGRRLVCETAAGGFLRVEASREAVLVDEEIPIRIDAARVHAFPDAVEPAEVRS